MYLVMHNTGHCCLHLSIAFTDISNDLLPWKHDILPPIAEFKYRLAFPI